MKADNSVVCFETFLGKIYLYKNETFITQEFNKGRYLGYRCSFENSKLY